MRVEKQRRGLLLLGCMAASWNQENREWKMRENGCRGWVLHMVLSIVP